jgi:hypothetical protein
MGGVTQRKTERDAVEGIAIETDAEQKGNLNLAHQELPSVLVLRSALNFTM